jgi:hypothetical protein
MVMQGHVQKASAQLVAHIAVQKRGAGAATAGFAVKPRAAAMAMIAIAWTILFRDFMRLTSCKL